MKKGDIVRLLTKIPGVEDAAAVGSHGKFVDYTANRIPLVEVFDRVTERLTIFQISEGDLLLVDPIAGR